MPVHIICIQIFHSSPIISSLCVVFFFPFLASFAVSTFYVHIISKHYQITESSSHILLLLLRSPCTLCVKPTLNSMRLFVLGVLFRKSLSDEESETQPSTTSNTIRWNETIWEYAEKNGIARDGMDTVAAAEDLLAE